MVSDATASGQIRIVGTVVVSILFGRRIILSKPSNNFLQTLPSIFLWGYYQVHTEILCRLFSPFVSSCETIFNNKKDTNEGYLAC